MHQPGPSDKHAHEKHKKYVDSAAEDVTNRRYRSQGSTRNGEPECGNKLLGLWTAKNHVGFHFRSYKCQTLDLATQARALLQRALNCRQLERTSPPMKTLQPCLFTSAPLSGF
jgi:hypothetical protein